MNTLLDLDNIETNGNSMERNESIIMGQNGASTFAESSRIESNVDTENSINDTGKDGEAFFKIFLFTLLISGKYCF